jgi:NAD(P)-dependent dehydrogenase (short-subunit alcohol dehydrogenase family)
MKQFADKVVVVTGAGSGIGEATAHAFAELGAVLHVVDLDEHRAHRVALELGQSGARAFAHVADVRDAAAIEAVADEVYVTHGRTDVLVNNAGVGHAGLVHEIALEDWQWVLQTNLWGVIHGVHSFVPRMIDQGGDAHIVNTASLAGLIGIPSMAPYCASKFAVVGLSESLGAELAPHGIKVTAVCPGVIATDIIRAGRFGEGVAGMRSRIETYYRKRGIKPEKVARDIVRAVRADRPLQLTIGAAYPMLWLRRLSPRLFRGAASLMARRILGLEPS